jgi:hypothetical protein
VRNAETDSQLIASLANLRDRSALNDIGAVMSHMMEESKMMHEGEVSAEEARTVAQRAISQLNTINRGYEEIFSFCETNPDTEEGSLQDLFTRLQSRVVTDKTLHKPANELDPEMK